MKVHKADNDRLLADYHREFKYCLPGVESNFPETDPELPDNELPDEQRDEDDPRGTPEIVVDREAIHRALKESLLRHTVRVRSWLP